VRELREADRTKSEFVSMLAHELKGPMTTVLGFSQTLRQQWEKLDDGKRNHVLDIIHKEVGRLSRLVNDLLDVSRMESGTLRYELEPIDLHEVVESLLTVHTSLRSEHAVIDQLPAGLPKVMADKDRIRQVIINLLTNATRYSPERSTVTLGADLVEEGGETFVRLSVTDEGIGISPHDVDRIFSKFAMLPKPSWTKKGTGLGLYITKGIVEALGGRIWVESEVGRGSTFYVTLRVAADESGS
jgi:signal transduction histidine kinase